MQRRTKEAEGQFNWAETQTHPDILLDCFELKSILKNATVEDFIKANKVLKKLCKEATARFPKLSNSKGHKFIAYHDASHANFKNRG